MKQDRKAKKELLAKLKVGLKESQSGQSVLAEEVFSSLKTAVKKQPLN